MSVLLAIKAFLLSEAPGFIKDVAVAFATDGVKAGVKRVFCGKKKEPVQEQLASLEEKLDFLVRKADTNANTTIREIASQLNGLVSSLHIKTAHEVLLKLRSDIPTSDQYTLSVVDYALGCCSRYVNKEQCMAEYSRAYTEMIGAERRDADIIGGKLYCLCLEKNHPEALRMANGLKELDRTHPWAWIPELVLAEDMEEAYGKMPDDIKTNLKVLANACIMKREETSLCVDIDNYKVEKLDVLNFENIPLWMFNMSVLTNRYIREWNRDAFMADTEVGSCCKELYEYTDCYLKLAEKTELGELSPEIELFHNITGYKILGQEETLVKIRESNASKPFLPMKQLSYVLYLTKDGKYEDAKEYLKGDEIVKEASIYNIRFYLAVVTADGDYARETLELLVASGTEMPGVLLVFLLMAIRDYVELLKDKVGLVKVEGETDATVYRELCHSFCHEAVDVDCLESHRGDVAMGLRPFVAIALFDAGKTAEALDLSESCVKDGFVDFSSHIYCDLLRRAKAYSRLDAFLRKVREGGFTGSPVWLKEEYALARKEEDFGRMLSIAETLYSQDNKNVSYYICYATMLCQNGRFDKVKELSERVWEYTLNAGEASQMFNVLVLSDMVEEAVGFLYNYIRRSEPNEQLAMLYHNACLIPKAAMVIRREYDEVEDGLYVTYKHKGEVRSDIIVKGQRTECMIGRRKGETVVVKDRMGRDEAYEVVSISNKYYQLMEEIFKEIHANKYKSTFSFTIDDLTANGDLLEGMARVAGHDEEWQAARQSVLEDYKQGKQSMSALFIGDEYIAELYNHLFGPFKVYNIPKNDFDVLYEKRGVCLDELEYVLDLSALILLYELHLKFGIDPNAKVIVPQGIVHLIDATIAKESYAMPAGIYQSVVDKLEVRDVQGESWLKTRLTGMKAWIEQVMTVEIAHEMLDVEMEEGSVFEQSHYLALVYQSAALTMRGGRAFVSEDMAMTAVFGRGFPVADVNVVMAHFHDDKYKEVSHFLIESDIYGGGMDVDYVLQEYDKYVREEEAAFAKCKENMAVCPYHYSVVLNFCALLYRRPVLTAVDTLTVEGLLRSMFGKFDQKTAGNILASAYRQLPQLRQELLGAYRSVYPLMWFN